eukprot:3455373-Rhodomonas_salina.1
MAISYGKLSNYLNAQLFPSLGPKMNTNTMIMSVLSQALPEVTTGCVELKSRYYGRSIAHREKGRPEFGDSQRDGIKDWTP